MLDQLIKLNGKPAFEDLGPKKGTLTVDSAGNGVPWKPGMHYASREWIDKQNEISYYLSSVGIYDQVVTQLIALKPADKFGHDWIKSENLDMVEKSK